MREFGDVFSGVFAICFYLGWIVRYQCLSEVLREFTYDLSMVGMFLLCSAVCTFIFGIIYYQLFFISHANQFYSLYIAEYDPKNIFNGEAIKLGFYCFLYGALGSALTNIVSYIRIILFLFNYCISIGVILVFNLYFGISLVESFFIGIIALLTCLFINKQEKIIELEESHIIPILLVEFILAIIIGTIFYFISPFKVLHWNNFFGLENDAWFTHVVVFFILIASLSVIKWVVVLVLGDDQTYPYD